MTFEIKTRFTGAVLFSLETESMRLCVEAAVKSCADLSGAYLPGAYLSGANGERVTLVGERPFLAMGPLGSRNATLQAWLTNAGVYVRAGCFWDTLDNFKTAVTETHGDSAHGAEYAAAIALIELHAARWTPTTADRSAGAVQEE